MMFDTNASIRFLLKEMDPSESLLFERELERNPDLLIELETLRNTLSRLEGASLVSAPDTILDRVRLQASATSASRRRRIARTRFLQAAAVLTMATVPSIYFASASWETSRTTDSPDRQADSNLSSPWVDRNETLRLADPSAASAARALGAQAGSASPMASRQFAGTNPASAASGSDAPSAVNGFAGSAGAAGFAPDSIYEASLRKLRPLTGGETPQAAPTQLQLTRSRQR